MKSVMDYVVRSSKTS